MINLTTLSINRRHRTENKPGGGGGGNGVGGGGGGRRLLNMEEKKRWAPEVMSFDAGSTTSFVSQLGFRRAVGGRSYGVVWFRRNGLFLNFPPAPPPPSYAPADADAAVPSPAVDILLKASRKTEKRENTAPKYQNWRERKRNEEREIRVLFCWTHTKCYAPLLFR